MLIGEDKDMYLEILREIKKVRIFRMKVNGENVRNILVVVVIDFFF